MMISHTLAAMLAASPHFLAQAPPAGGSGNPLASQFFFILPLFVLMYFLLIRPQKKRQRELETLIASVAKGDKVLTTGGIYGFVAEVKERTVTVTIAPNVIIEMEKTSIAAVINPKKAEAVVVSTATKAKA